MPVTRRSFGLAALGGALVSAVPALAKAPLAGTQVPGVYRLKVGAFEVTVLSDGWIPLQTKLFSGDSEGATKLLERAFLAKDATPTSVNEWLVNTGDRLVLVDTGTSNVFAPTLGRMAKHLAEAGVDPAAVDAVILTHLHPDHAGGLLTTEKKIAFPNASVHVHEAEYGFWTSPDVRGQAPAELKSFFDIAQAAIKPYVDAGKVRMFKNNSELFPGISLMMAPWHTGGHTMFRGSPNAGQLLRLRDSVHTEACQCPRHEPPHVLADDQSIAISSRKAVYAMVLDDTFMIAGDHLPFP